MPSVQVKLTEFEDLIKGYTADFVGRKWLVEQVDSLLAHPDCRFVVLTGGPGVGKSAFMAHLAATRVQWLRYFIRRDSRELLSSSDGKTFLLTVGGQLATLQPGLFKPEKLEVVAQQRIGDLESSGEAVGVRIQELRASPFYSVSVRAEQEIQRVAGKVTGVEIGRLVTEPRSLTVQDLQYLGLLDPAWLLYQTDREARIVVLVDALDQLRFSPSESDILDALCQLPVGVINREGPKAASPAQKLPQIPPNLRFLISSRREKFLDRLLRRSDVRELPLSVVGNENRKDLRTYAKVNLPKDGLESVLAGENRTTDSFVRDLLEKAAGNFLYLRSVLGAIKEALAEPEKSERLHSLLLVGELPDDLNSLYGYFLNSIVDWVNRRFGEAAWRKYLRPLLGVLAVAREPLKERQLLVFTDLGSEDLGDLLRELRQFVEPENGQAFRIYHTSFAEYLLDDVTNVDYRIDGLKWHKRIADFYRGKAKSWTKVNWNKVDDYGVRHLGTHLYALRDDPGYGGELYTLLCKPYMWAKFGRTGSHRGFGQDVSLALDAARHETPPHLVQVARACLLYATLGNISEVVPSELLGVLAQVGERASALGYAALISDAAQRSKVYLKIADASSSKIHGKELLDIVDMALLAVEAISNEALKAKALSGVAQTLMQMGEKERGQSAAFRAFEAVKKIEKEEIEPQELRVLAQTMLQAGEYARALEVSEMITDEEVKTEALIGLVRALAQDGKHDQALEVTETIKDKKVKAEALSSLAQTLIEMRQGERARNAAKRAFEVLKKIKDRWIKEQVQDRVIQALALAGEHDQALKAAETSRDRGVKAASLTVLAQALAQTGESARAQGTARRALHVAETIEEESDKAEALAKVAGALVTMGERELARSTAERVLEVMKTIENELGQAMAAAQREMEEAKLRTEPIDHTRYATRRMFGVEDKTVKAEKIQADAARVLAQAIARPGDFDRVLEVVEKIKNEGVKAELLTGLTQILVQSGEYDLALQMAETIEGELRRAIALTGLAESLAPNGKKGLARSALGGAFAVATEISVNKSPATEAEALSVLARLAQMLAQVEEHDRALQVTEIIGNEWGKAEELRVLAQTLGQTTEGGRARSTARRALEAVKSTGDERVKAEALTRLAEALVQMGEKDKARSAARRALEAVKKIKVGTGSDEWDKATALSELAPVFVQLREHDQVLRVTETIGEDVRKEKVLTGLAQALVQSGEYDQGLEVANMIHSDGEKAQTWAVLAQALVQMGQKERAQQVASRALKSAGGATWAVDTVNESLKVLAHVLGQTGEGARARRAARQVLEGLKTIWNASTKTRALTELARVLVEAGEYDGVLKVAETIKDEQIKARALSRVVQTLMQMGQKERARSVARQVVEVVDKIDDEWDKATALSDVAQVLVQAGEYDRALGLAEMIRDRESKAAALNGLAQAAVKMGEKERARSAARRVLEVAKTVGDSWSKMKAKTGAAQVLVRVGEYDQGLKVVEMIRDKGDKARALTELAESLLQMGEGARAHSTARRGLKMAEGMIGTEQAKSKAKTVLIQALLQLGEYDEVLEVLGRYYIAPKELSDVAQALAQAGESDRALEVVEGIAHGVLKHGVVRVLAELVHALVQMEQNDLARTAASWALEVGKKLEHKGIRAEELSGLAEVLVKVRKYDWALEVAERIRDEEVKAKALSGVGQALVDAGDYDRALEVAETIGHEGVKAEALAELAQALTHTRADEARQIVIQALDSGRLHSRDAVFSVLSKSAGALAQLDPESVWGISEAIAEIDAW